jgi:hypothetical protein
MVGMKPVTREDIATSLVNMSPADIAVMSFPGLHETLWDEREFLGWRDAHHPRRGYLVFWVGQSVRGIMVTAAPSAMPAGKAAMCALCHTQQPAPQVSLFTAPKAGDEGARGNTVGTYLCSDLSCSAIIRMLPDLPGSILDPAAALAAKGDSIRARLESFSNRVLSSNAA